MIRFTFKKEERLKSSKTISALFSEGKSFGRYPLRLVWMPLEQGKSAAPVQLTVSVAKKKFPRAVDRNRIKRQIREAWRLHKHELYADIPEGTHFAMMILYTAKEFSETILIEEKVVEIIDKFRRKELQ